MKADTCDLDLEGAVQWEGAPAPRPASRARRALGPPSTTWTVGRKVGDAGRYEVGAVLGRGGVGIVYSLYDHILKRRIAGKLPLHPMESAAREALEAEARVTAQLSHPNVVRAYDYVLADDQPCLLLEQIDAPTLQTVLAAGRMSCQRALHVVIQLVQALEHAHSRGVSHLDVKPGNIFIGRSGHIKLFDFGVGCRLTMGCDSAAESFVVGTPGYMAPEQWAFEAVDGRADIWAVGMLLHELLHGHTANWSAFSTASSSRTRWEASGLPPSLRRVFAGTLAMDPSDRVAHVGELLEPLRQAVVEVCEADSGRLSADERLVAAAGSLLSLGCALSARSVPVLRQITALPEASVRRAWEGLARRGVVGAVATSHWNTGECLMQGCFSALHKDQRRALSMRAARLHRGPYVPLPLRAAREETASDYYGAETESHRPHISSKSARRASSPAGSPGRTFCQRSLRSPSKQQAGHRG